MQALIEQIKLGKRLLQRAQVRRMCRNQAAMWCI